MDAVIPLLTRPRLRVLGHYEAAYGQERERATVSVIPTDAQRHAEQRAFMADVFAGFRTVHLPDDTPSAA